MNFVRDWLLVRLKEQSTWIGFTTLLAGIGISFSPDQVEAITAAGVAVIGVVYAFFPENGKLESKDVDLDRGQ